MARFDTIIIGGGSAGSACAYALAAGGKHVALVEHERVGGECAFWACVPSKVLLRSAIPNAQSAKTPGSRETRDGAPDFTAAAAWRTSMVDNYSDTSHASELHESGATLLRGNATILAPGRVRVDNAEHEASTIVVATGSSGKLPKLDGLAEGRPFWTSRDATSAGSQPASLTILGGGAVGVELAQIYARYGTHVTLIETSEHLLPQEEAAAGERVAAFLANDGVDVRTKMKPKRVTWNDDSHTLALDDGTTITAERLCVATGRKPRTADLGLESAGVTLDDDGAITVDETCRAAQGIYAVGDVTNIAPLTHVAKYQARIAAASILGSHAKARYDAVPRCIYTAPEFAAAGITRKEAAGRGIELLTAQVTFDEITRPALYSDPPADGALELFADAKTRKLIGGWTINPTASEIIGFLTSAIIAATPLETLLDVIQPYPTFSEAFYVACDRLTRM